VAGAAGAAGAAFSNTPDTYVNANIISLKVWRSLHLQVYFSYGVFSSMYNMNLTETELL